MRRVWKNTAAFAPVLAAAPRLLVTLDFDGTLSALAASPGQARMGPEFRKALKTLAASPGISVFILSGRALNTVRRLVGLRGLYYGGNHGIEIHGPGFAWRDRGASKARVLVADISAGIKDRFPPCTGVLMENKVFSASVHYRNIRSAHRREFFAWMKALMSARKAGLRWRRGHRIFELLPLGAADKGEAVKRLARRLGRPLVVAVGDDLTDEDMFRVYARSGVTVRVGRSGSSYANYYLNRQSEVLKLLRLIIKLRRKK